MYDMNFFSVYKKRRAKNKGLMIFVIVVLTVLLVLNGLLIGGSMWLFGELESDIQAKRDWINDPATREAINEAARLREEVDVLQEYYALLTTVGDNLEFMDVIDSQLLDEVRARTPETVYFESMNITGRQVTIQCHAETVLDAMDMHHAFVESDLFFNVMLSGISISDNDQQPVFSISFSVQGVSAE